MTVNTTVNISSFIRQFRTRAIIILFLCIYSYLETIPPLIIPPNENDRNRHVNRYVDRYVNRYVSHWQGPIGAHSRPFTPIDAHWRRPLTPMGINGGQRASAVLSYLGITTLWSPTVWADLNAGPARQMRPSDWPTGR